MSVTGTKNLNWSSMGMGAFLAILTGLALWWMHLGENCVNASYDIACLFGGQAAPENVVIIRMDQDSLDAMNLSHLQWPPGVHARLLDYLRADHCPLVVFDVTFSEPHAPAEVDVLREAIRRHGRVVLGARRFPNSDPNFPGEHTWRPTHLLAGTARWGLVGPIAGGDATVRRLFTGIGTEPSLAWAAAEQYGVRLPDLEAANHRPFWIRYGDPEHPTPSLGYHQATNQPPGFFRDKIVFIGGKPSVLYLEERSDVFHTPFTLRTGETMPGVELVVTMFLNLLRHDYLQRMPAWAELSLLLLTGLLFGAGLSLVRPLRAAGLAALGLLVVAGAGVGTFWFSNVWWAWMVVAGGQIPCALAWSVLYRTHWLSQALAGALAPPGPTGPDLAPGPAASPGSRLPVIPEHTLLRRIGEGAYGEVWLARDAVGAHHAVKVVYRARFENDPKPFEREFRGISAYSPLSLSHPGLLHVLLVGWRETEGCFYYIMELGDDRSPGPVFNPDTYAPRNLGHDLATRKRLPISECIDITAQLAGALTHLHQHGLVHRDIKPSNIVFVKGVPKLADIGLVTLIAPRNKEDSYVGTEGYIAPEGPGSVAADIYSLGVVLYRMWMGLSAKQFPTLSNTLYARPDLKEAMQLNNIITTACASEPAQRYPSAAALRAALLELKERLKAQA